MLVHFGIGRGGPFGWVWDREPGPGHHASTVTFAGHGPRSAAFKFEPDRVRVTRGHWLDQVELPVPFLARRPGRALPRRTVGLDCQ
jgi:hypothetical protein